MKRGKREMAGGKENGEKKEEAGGGMDEAGPGEAGPGEGLLTPRKHGDEI